MPLNQIETLVGMMDWQKAHELYVSKRWKWGLRGHTRIPTPDELREAAIHVLNNTLSIQRGRQTYTYGRIYGRRVGEELELFFGSSKQLLMLVRLGPTQPRCTPPTLVSFTKFEFEPPV